MKTAVTEVMEIIEMEHNNGVEISQKMLWKMLLKAKEKEKHQIIDAHSKGQQWNKSGYNPDVSEQYYKETYETI